MSFKSREDYIYFARLAEQGERYEDMIRYMKEVSNVSESSKTPKVYGSTLKLLHSA
jgi:hypothetical protein